MPPIRSDDQKHATTPDSSPQRARNRPQRGPMYQSSRSLSQDSLEHLRDLKSQMKQHFERNPETLCSVNYANDPPSIDDFQITRVKKEHIQGVTVHDKIDQLISNNSVSPLCYCRLWDRDAPARAIVQKKGNNKFFLVCGKPRGQWCGFQFDFDKIRTIRKPDTGSESRVRRRNNPTHTPSRPLNINIGPNVVTAGEQQRQLDEAVSSVSTVLHNARNAGHGLNLGSMHMLGVDWTPSCQNCKVSFGGGHHCYSNTGAGKAAKRADDAIDLDSSDEEGLETQARSPRFDMESFYRAGRYGDEDEEDGQSIIDLTGGP